MPLSAAPVNDADSLLLMLCEGVLPFWFPIALLVLLVAFRGLWAELFAEAVFIYRRRLESLEGAARERRFLRRALRVFWKDFCAWHAAIDRDDPEAGALLGKALAALRAARLFLPAGADAEKLAAWEGRLREAEAAAPEARKAVATALAVEVPAFCAETDDRPAARKG